MAVLSVDHAEPGMVLAAAVTDRQGRLLIPQGKELSERHVQALKMWGVAQIDVEGEGDAADAFAAVEPEVLQEAEATLEARFARVDRSHPFLEQLFQYCVNRKARALQKDSEADHAA